MTAGAALSMWAQLTYGPAPPDNSAPLVNFAGLAARTVTTGSTKADAAASAANERRGAGQKWFS
jgi:hypothetical protein